MNIYPELSSSRRCLEEELSEGKQELSKERRSCPKEGRRRRRNRFNSNAVRRSKGRLSYSIFVFNSDLEGACS